MVWYLSKSFANDVNFHYFLTTNPSTYPLHPFRLTCHSGSSVNTTAQEIRPLVPHQSTSTLELSTRTSTSTFITIKHQLRYWCPGSTSTSVPGSAQDSSFPPIASSINSPVLPAPFLPIDPDCSHTCFCVTIHETIARIGEELDLLSTHAYTLTN